MTRHTFRLEGGKRVTLDGDNLKAGFRRKDGEAAGLDVVVLPPHVGGQEAGDDDAEDLEDGDTDADAGHGSNVAEDKLENGEFLVNKLTPLDLKPNPGRPKSKFAHLARLYQK